jgi:gamma-glutamylcyclotransferase (GGCT)/AIG2-like uncharacterized protein YtfP
MQPPVSTSLFVYSSLLKGFHQDHFRYISQYFTPVTSGKVRGILSEFNGELFAMPSLSDSLISGELYQLNNPVDFSYVFGQLDDYEGIDVELGDQPLYRRALASILTETGQEILAWIYWFNEDVKGHPAPTTGASTASSK